MTRRRIGFLAFDGVQALDLIGPADAFASDAFSGKSPAAVERTAPPYEIDLALAMIEADHGADMALAVAREMVVYFKRPGGQQQFSEPLRFQLESTDRFADVVTWIQSHLQADLSVDALAKKAFLSPRHF